MAHRVYLAALATLAIAAPSCVVDAEIPGRTGMFDRQLTVNGPVKLTVKTGSGSIDVRTGSVDRVRIIGRIRAHGVFWTGVDAERRVKQLESTPPIEQDGQTIRIGELSGPNRWFFDHVSISYELTVPPDTQLESRSGSGSQSFEGIRRSLNTSTGSGSIEASHIGGHVRASTGSGSISVNGAENGLDLRAGSGSIDAEGVAGEVTAHTGSGGISMEGRPTQDWTLRTGSGHVSVRVPKDVSFDLHARAGSGSIRTSEAVVLEGPISSHQIEAKVRGGGPRIDVSTGSGGIDID